MAPEPEISINWEQLTQAAGAAAYFVFTTFVGLLVYLIQDHRKIAAEREARDAQARADRQSREHQSEIEKSLHLARIAFEREFKIYQELWKKTIALRRVVFDLRPSVTNIDPDESEEARFERKRLALNAAYGEFVAALDENVPFYSLDIFSILERVRKAAEKEAQAYRRQIVESRQGRINPDPFTEAEQNQKALLELIDEAGSAIRTRFSQAPVLAPEKED